MIGSTASAATKQLRQDLVTTIEAIEEGDLLVINDDTRTWEVTDVVERSVDDPSDARVGKRVLRLAVDTAVFGLELEEYPQHHEASLHVLETDDCLEADRVYDVESIEILDQQVPWVVVTSGTDTYHFPDPYAAAYGEAEPACGGSHQDSEYRITRINTIVPRYRGCKSCIRHAKPVTLQPVRCPDCDKTVCHGLFQRFDAAAVDGIAITCQRTNCEFEGIVNATTGGAR